MVKSHSFSITRLTVKNFRQFREGELKLSAQPGRNITLVEGANGSGKSNLALAMQWCLFGSQPRDPRFSYCQLCNSKVFRELKPDADAEIRVDLHLSLPDGQVVFSRRVKVCKNKAGHEQVDNSTMQFTCGRIKDGAVCEVPRPERLVEELFGGDLAALAFIEPQPLRFPSHGFSEEDIKDALRLLPKPLSAPILHLCGQTGTSGVNCLSAAEGSFLFFAMVALLRRRGRLKSPVIMDSPFMYLDRQKQAAFGAWFSEEFKDSQIILLLNSSGYAKEIIAALLPTVGGIFQILPTAARDVATVKKRARVARLL